MLNIQILLTSLVWNHRTLALEKDLGNHSVLSLHVAAEKIETQLDKLLAISNISKYVACIKFFIMLVKVLVR